MDVVVPALVVALNVTSPTPQTAVGLDVVTSGNGFTVIVAGDDTAFTQPLPFFTSTVYVVVAVNAEEVAFSSVVVLLVPPTFHV
jgi:hypothetical protein